MKNFWGSFLGALTGIVVASVLCTVIFLVGMAVIFATAFKGDKSNDDIKITDKAILHLKLDYPIEDRTNYNPFASGFNFDDLDPKLGMKDLISAINYASTDEKVKGIYLEMSAVPSGMATLEEIRASLVKFRKSGKFIYTYSNGLTQKAYYIASVSDEIHMHPNAGGVDLKGLSANLVFFKNTMEKLGLEPIIIRPTGNRFKSAVEPFFLDKASEANRMQMQQLLNAMWNKMTADMGEGSGLTRAELDSIASVYGAYNSINAQQLGLINDLKYEDEMHTFLKEKAGVEKDNDLNLVPIHKYFKKVSRKIEKKSKNKIAVVYASGSIVGGKGDNNEIGGTTFVNAIRDAREDEDVKAVVLRVNSPGGDAIASELIWREVYLTEKVKPIVVSMGNYAASGGYYIACAADTIVADETTLTGSIGVFSVLFSMEKLLNDKLGITTDTIKTHMYSDFPNVTKPFNERERDIFQRQVDDIYTLFLKRVAEGRNMTTAQVDSIAQGRVWAGSDAIKIGLVDKIGTLDTAITIATKMANLENYQIVEYPEDNDPFSKFFKDLSSSSANTLIREYTGENLLLYLQHLHNAKNMKGVQTRLPYMIDIE